MNTHVNANGVKITETEREVRYVGPGEFFTGIKTGDVVILRTTTYTHPDGHENARHSVSKPGGAALGLYDLDRIAEVA